MRVRGEQPEASLNAGLRPSMCTRAARAAQAQRTRRSWCSESLRGHVAWFPGVGTRARASGLRPGAEFAEV